VCILSKLGTCTVDVPGIRLTELKHVIGLTKLNYMELGHAVVGDLGRETVGVLGPTAAQSSCQPLCRVSCRSDWLS
jgi:hypothetical protein